MMKSRVLVGFSSPERRVVIPSGSGEDQTDPHQGRAQPDSHPMGTPGDGQLLQHCPAVGDLRMQRLGRVGEHLTKIRRHT
jgi:hypothetical protein